MRFPLPESLRSSTLPQGGAYNAFAGAIAGEAKDTSIKNSHATGTISAQAGGFGFVGGLVGIAGNVGLNDDTIGYLTVENSYNAVTIHDSSSSQWAIGGIVGGMINSSISNSYNIGEIRDNNFSAGIVGYMVDSSVSESYNRANLHATGGAGGIAFHMDNSTIERSYSAANINVGIELGNPNPSSDTIAGGIAALMENGSIITNSYSTGTITNRGASGMDTGGIVGYAGDSVIATVQQESMALRHMVIKPVVF